MVEITERTQNLYSEQGQNLLRSWLMTMTFKVDWLTVGINMVRDIQNYKMVARIVKRYHDILYTNILIRNKVYM